MVASAAALAVLVALVAVDLVTRCAAAVLFFAVVAVKSVMSIFNPDVVGLSAHGDSISHIAALPALTLAMARCRRGEATGTLPRVGWVIASVRVRSARDRACRSRTSRTLVPWVLASWSPSCPPCIITQNCRDQSVTNPVPLDA